MPSHIDYDAKLLASQGSQSRAIGCSETAVIRSSQALKKMVEFPFENNENKPTICTLWQSFVHGYSINSKGNCLGFRPFVQQNSETVRGPYQWLSYEDVFEKVLSLAGNISNMDIFSSDSQENIGIFAKNRVEWSLSMLAIWHQNHRVIPFYDTLGEDATMYILEQTGLKLIFAETSELGKIWSALQKNNTKQNKEEEEDEEECELKSIVYFDTWKAYNNTHETITEEDEKMAKEFDINLIPFSSLINDQIKEAVDMKAIAKLSIQSNEENIEDKTNTYNKYLCNQVNNDADLAIIMYTSGTTGLPKGVMLSHANVVSSVGVFAEQQYLGVLLDTTDRHISYLPLAHIFEITVECTMLCCGASIGYFQGDIRKLTDDFGALKPTILCGVPRVFQKVYDKVHAQAALAGGIKKLLINKALSSGTACVRKNEKTTGTIWDKLVFSKIREGAGLTDVRVVFSGAAPLPGYLMEFLQVITGADVRQGYGMTETVCAGGTTTLGDSNVGHVGPPTPNCEVKLRDVPEMNYFHTDKYPRGEIMIRGPSMFQGYYQLPEKTKETLITSEDSKYNWVATGDIGRFNPNGTVTIIDRRKNIFKLAQGEYVAVEKIESAYLKTSSINQIWVYGNSFKTILMAVVVCDATWLAGIAKREKWDDLANISAKTQNVGSKEHCEWYQNMVEKHEKEIKQMIKKDMKANCESGLKGFEKVKDIILESELGELLTGFTVENDLLTPSMKLKRPMLLKKYVDELKQLYSSNNQPPDESEHWLKV